jgi:NAD(P)-dependent dehydrogenase (short-subunit alcohol dehydrogenase family)
MTDSVLVTGSSTGFGKAIALHLAEQGFQVYASMRDLSRRAALEQAASERGLRLRVLRLDVTDSASIAEAVQTVVEESGGIYGLVNNAGLILRGYFEDLDEAEIRQLFDTNLFGTMAVTRAVLPHMRVAGRGRVIIITSVAGKIGSPSGSAYSASRFAQEGFAESLWQELAPLGVRVVLVEPGITKTESWTVDRGAGARARNPASPYYQWFCRAEQLFDRVMQRSPNQPLDVARAIHVALAAPRPQLRYMVARRARLVTGLRRYIPGELFDRWYFTTVMRQVTGLPDVRL